MRQFSVSHAIRWGLTGVLFLSAGAASAQPLPAIGPEFRVNVATSDNQTGAAVAAEFDRGYVVVFRSGSAVVGRRFDAAGAPRGGDFTVNVAPIGLYAVPSVAAHSAGGFLVTWWAPDASGAGIFARLFDASGQPVGGEIAVNTTVTGDQFLPRVSAGPIGYVVVWYDGGQMRARRFAANGVPAAPEIPLGPGSNPDVAVRADGFLLAWNVPGGPGFTEWVKVRAFDAAGAPVGAEVVVNGADPPPPVPALTSFHRPRPRIAAAANGAFAVTWWMGAHSVTGGAVMEIFDFDYGTFARLFDASSAPRGPEFRVNVFDPGQQSGSVVAVSPQGKVFFAWYSAPRPECFSCPIPPSQDGSGSGIYARQYDAAGNDLSGEIRVNQTTAGDQYSPQVAAAGEQGALVVWESPDGSGTGIFAQRYGSLVPAGVEPALLEVDPTDELYSDGNGVLENWEAVVVAPAWRNVGSAAQAVASVASAFTGPPGATYSLFDATADFGVIASGQTRSCRETLDCFGLTVFGARPAPHWDAQFTEAVQPPTVYGTRTRTLHVGDSFFDMPRSSSFYRFVETVLHNDVMSACASGLFCPFDVVRRDAMALHVLKAFDPALVPSACVPGSEMFADVPASSPYCRWVEELARRGVIAGCGGGNYCPDAGVSRETLAVYVLATREGLGYAPPACGAPLFADVPASSSFCPWIEELARRGIVGGCGGGLYCPTLPVARDQMSVFLTGTFGLLLYAP